jgi:hypothetical protein
MRSNFTSYQAGATGPDGCYHAHMNEAEEDAGWREVRLVGDSDAVLPHSHTPEPEMELEAAL